MSWSAHQVALLQGMGFDTMRLRGANDFARAPAGAAVGPASAATAVPSRPTPHAPRTVATEVTPTVAPADKLLAALRLAAGGRDPLAVAGDLDALRRDPARKRALWPRLRALRRLQ